MTCCTTMSTMRSKCSGANRCFAALQIRCSRPRRLKARQPSHHPRRYEVRRGPSDLCLFVRCGREGYPGRDRYFGWRRIIIAFIWPTPGLRWLKLNAVGMEVSIQEVSEQVAALALQGPNSLRILQRVVDAKLGQLRFFRFTFADCWRDSRNYFRGPGIPAISDTKSGLLRSMRERVWDVLMEAGQGFGIRPAGMLALDVARLEAGFILLEVDYIGVEKALNPSQKYTPFEIGLGWTVDLKKAHFVGLRELRKGSERGASRQVVGLEIDST